MVGSCCVFFSGERSLNGDILRKCDGLPCGHISFRGLPAVHIVEESSELWLRRVQGVCADALAYGLPVTNMGFLGG